EKRGVTLSASDQVRGGGGIRGNTSAKCASRVPLGTAAVRTDFKFAPKICGQEIDLHALYKTVTAAGGSGKDNSTMTTPFSKGRYPDRNKLEPVPAATNCQDDDGSSYRRPAQSGQVP
ncbi:AT-rich interactive domain-containing protein 2-like, partial [Tropilaelaps mercedesae]